MTIRKLTRFGAMTTVASSLFATLLVAPLPAQAKSLPTVTIGYENNGADPEMVAIAEGYFSKYMHARVDMRMFSSGPAALAALAAGSLQFMTGIGNPPAVSAIARGVPLKVIWAQEMYTKDEGLVVRKNSGIKNLKDLKGKTVALVLGSTSPFELDTALQRSKIPIPSVRILNMSPPSMRAAWTNGQIQAAYVWDPVFDSLVHDNGRVLMYDLNVSKQAPIFNLAVVNSKWAKTNGSLVQGFISAEAAGMQFYHSHPAKALADMAKEAGISVKLAKTELSGFRLLTPAMQLSTVGLGYGKTVKSSLVTKSLTSAAKYLYQSNTISENPSNMAQYVDPIYVHQYVRQHPKG